MWKDINMVLISWIKSANLALADFPQLKNSIIKELRVRN